MASNSTSLDPQKLPPIERAVYYHSLRVHLQIRNSMEEAIKWA